MSIAKPSDPNLRFVAGAYQAGEHMQFLESRRFLESEVERHLNKYGLDVIASQRFDKYGFYLCCKAKLCEDLYCV